MPHVRLTIKLKVRIPESFKVGWYPHKITGRVTLTDDNKEISGKKKLAEQRSLNVFL